MPAALRTEGEVAPFWDEATFIRVLESHGIDCPWNLVKRSRRENEMKNPGGDAAGEKYGKIEELFCTLMENRGAFLHPQPNQGETNPF